MVGVLGQQIGDGITALGRVDEVRRDGGVELKPAQRMAVSQQGTHERLHVVATHRGHRAQCIEHLGVGHHGGIEPQHIGRCRVEHHGDAGEFAAARVARPGGGTIGQRLELEEVEQFAHFGVVGREPQLVDIDIEGHIAHQHHEVGVGPRLGLVRAQCFTQFRRLFVDVGENAVETAVGGDELRGRLLAHPGDAGEVVAGVATHGRVIDVLRGRDTRALENASLVVQRVVAHTTAVVEHAHVRVGHQLVAVTVAGDDDDVVTRLLGPFAEGGDDVVGFEAHDVDRGDVQRRQHLTHQPHLLAQDVGGGFALRLVLGVGNMAERGLGAVERHRNSVGTLIFDEVDEHRREAEHRVGDLPTGRDHVGG